MLAVVGPQQLGLDMNRPHVKSCEIKEFWQGARDYHNLISLSYLHYCKFSYILAVNGLYVNRVMAGVMASDYPDCPFLGLDTISEYF